MLLTCAALALCFISIAASPSSNSKTTLNSTLFITSTNQQLFDPAGNVIGPDGGTTLSYFAVGQGAPAYVTQNPITYHGSVSVVMTGFGTDHADTPIYLIYYTASTINYFSSAKKNIIETFINGVSSTSYWNIVRQYYYQAPSPPNLKYYIGGIYKYTSITVFCDSNSYAVGCNLGQSDLVTLVTNVVAKGTLPNTPLAIYTVISAPEIIHTVGMQNNAAAVIGKDLCSYKTLSWNGAWYYKIVYAAVPNLNGATYKWGTQSPSICFNKNRASSPNSAALGGDTQIDALIPFLDHEIIETLIQPQPLQGHKSWNDDTTLAGMSIEAKDKCELLYTEVQTIGSYSFNLIVSNTQYLIQPIFDLTTSKCAMSNTNPVPAQPARYVVANLNPSGSGYSTLSGSCSEYGRYACSGKGYAICNYVSSTQLNWVYISDCSSPQICVETWKSNTACNLYVG